ncbi:oligosaccharide flippase family protein [Myroides odoratimimus]|uniref:oligosaccharide flippase family protein n=1 Tax=Myroides odoratimimus TaxID=76832 RepID=UPI002576AD1E|nr:oligosaccharide flippase family protein [Myroides odoratimimus]MDM1415687.1 oligosaccharide flippase family protein [Myroides odoratimimus]
MSFLKKTILSLSFKGLSAILGLVNSILLAKILGAYILGKYQLLVSSQTIAITIAAMGFGNSIIYFVKTKKYDIKLVTTNILKFFTLVSFLFVTIYFIIISFYPEYFGVSGDSVVLLYSLGSGFLLLYTILLPVLYVNLEVVKLNCISLLTTLVMIISLFFLKYSDIDIDIVIVLKILFLSNAIPFIVLLLSIKHYLSREIRISFSLIKEIFAYGIKISVTNLVFILSSNIVVFLIRLMDNDGFTSVGIYSRAVAIASIFAIIPNTIGPLFYSKWAGMSNNELKLEVEKALRFLITLSVIGALFLICFGKYIILMMYGKEYLGALASLQILSSSIIFTSVIVIMNNLYTSMGKPERIFKVYFVSLFVTSIISVLLIPLIGSVGAACGVLIGLIFNCIRLFISCKKDIDISYSNSILVSRGDFVLLKKKINKK